MDHRSIGTASLVRQLGAWRDGRGAAYRQLADSLRLLILDGRVPLAARLPGERELATALGLSRTTASAAFAMLRDEGYLESRQGSGSLTRVPGPHPARPPVEGARLDRDVVDLAIATVPASGSVHRAYRRALELLPEHLAGHGYEPSGLEQLRCAVAERYSRRGCPTRPGQIMITNGAVNGFALVLKLLAGPGDRVVIDHPSYPHAIDAIHQASCRPEPVSLIGNGWDADALEAAIRQTSPRLAFLIPDFHNPTGLCMESPTRERLAGIAARTRTTLVIDETLSELWFDAPPPPSLAAFDVADRVIALGSTGKTFWGGLRIGWIRASEATIEALIRVRPTIDLGTPVVEQIAAAMLLSEAEADLEQRRHELRARRDALSRMIAQHFPDWRADLPAGGLSLWAEMPEPVGARLAAAAETYGVRIAPGARFGVDGAFARFLRLPFTLPEAALETGIARLAQAYQGTRVARRGAARVQERPSEQVY